VRFNYFINVIVEFDEEEGEAEGEAA